MRGSFGYSSNWNLRGGKRDAMPARLKPMRPPPAYNYDAWEPPCDEVEGYRGPPAPPEPPRRPLWKRVLRSISRWLARISA